MGKNSFSDQHFLKIISVLVVMCKGNVKPITLSIVQNDFCNKLVLKVLKMDSLSDYRHRLQHQPKSDLNGIIQSGNFSYLDDCVPFIRLK